MIEKTRKKQHCPLAFKQSIARIIPVLLMLFITTNLLAQMPVCSAPTGHTATFDIAADCDATRTVTDGLAYNLTVDPNVRYSFTVCDPNFMDGGSSPYLELWDAPNGNFLAASTTTNGCATVTHSNCTPIQDYTLSVRTQHGTSMCDVDNNNYTFTSTCTPNTFTCPTTTEHIKLQITDDIECCFTGLMPLPDLSGINCLDDATLVIEYTKCDGTSTPETITLPDADNAILVELPLEANSQNISYTVTIDGVSETCSYPVTVTKTLTCTANVNVSLDSDCVVQVASSAFTNQGCDGVAYPITYTVNGAEVPELTSAYFGFTNIQAIVTAPDGNTCSSTIKLSDNQAPKFTSCPSDITLVCGQSTETLNIGMATATDCTGVVGDVTFIDQSTTLPNCAGEVITRTFFATDNNGLTGTCQQVITLEPIDVMDIVYPPNYIDLDPTGPNEMILSCTDHPIGTPPGIDVTGGLSINGMALNVGMNCDYLITMNDVVIPICGGAYDIFRTWEITNWCDPTADPIEHQQIIKVKDKDGPEGTEGVVSFVNSGNACTNEVIVGAASFMDGCSAVTADDFIITLSGSGTTFTSSAQGASAVFTNVPYGVFNVTWQAQDECGNQGEVSAALTIEDNTPPVAFCENRQITLNAANNYEFEFCTNLLDDGSVDNCGNVTLLLKDANDATASFTECIDLSCANIDLTTNTNTITMMLQATDNVGNSSSVNCDVTLVLSDPICPTFSTVEINCNEDPTASDEWGVFSYAVASDCNPTEFELGDLIDITDVCGPTTVLQTWTNSMTGLNCTQPVRINPLVWDVASFVAPVDVTIECSNVADLNDITEAEIAAVDPLGNLFIDRSNTCYTSQVLEGVITKSLLSDDACQALVLKTYKIIDQCLFTGNLAAPIEGEAGFYTFTQQITVSDNTDPNFDVSPQDFEVSCVFQLPALPTATDNCNTATVTVDASSLGTPDEFGNYTTDPGIYMISYTATDLCNNSSTVFVDVTVNSPESVLTCLLDGENIDLGTTCSRTLTASDIFTATDPCNVGVDMTVQIVTDPNNPPTTMPTTTTVVLGPDNIGDVQVQIWAAIAGTVFEPQICTINVTDQNCVCTDGVTFAVSGANTGAGCSFDATISNLNTTDNTIIWESNPACDGSLTCNYTIAGTYDVTVTDNVTGCSTTQSVELVETVISLEEADFVPPCTVTITNIIVDGETISDFTGYTINLLFDGVVVQTITSPNTSFTGMENGPYTINLTNPNGCSSQEVVMTCSNLRIGGLIANEDGDKVDEVTVQISDAIDPIITDHNGAYLFEDVNPGGNYTVTPEKNVNPLNGVTTFDLVLMSRHILGVTLLDSPYKLIAADANNSGSVTTLDLVKIQRVILGLDEDFAPIDSWKFVDAGFTFPNPINPFQTTIPVIYPINNLDTDMDNVDFVGVKIGDVNGTAVANQLLQTDTRSNGQLNFEIQNQQFDKGATFEVDFTSASFESMLGYQFTLQFDERMMEFVEIKSGALEQLSEENFGLNKVEDGLITTSWFNQKATSLKSDEVIFTMVFKAKESGEIADAFEITSGITSNEIYRSANNEVEILTVDLIVNGATSTSEEVTLFQNSPNPFNESTQIQFYLPETGDATILIFDYSGKIVHEINREFQKGMNEISIDKATLQTTGVLFYQLETQQFTATKKMLLVD